MIAYVKGILEDVETDAVVLDVSGVGFRVYTPINEALLRKGTGSEVKLFTYMNVREDAMILFGFLDKDTLHLFEQLISVNGVGPRSALQILSSISTTDLILAICRDDKKALTQVNGIGAKTAARIILDLKDKVNTGAVSAESDTTIPMVSQRKVGPAAEAVMALVELGFSQTEAEKAVSQCAAEGMSTEAILRISLKLLY